MVSMVSGCPTRQGGQKCFHQPRELHCVCYPGFSSSYEELCTNGLERNYERKTQVGKSHSMTLCNLSQEGDMQSIFSGRKLSAGNQARPLKHGPSDTARQNDPVSVPMGGTPTGGCFPTCPGGLAAESLKSSPPQCLPPDLRPSACSWASAPHVPASGRRGRLTGA